MLLSIASRIRSAARVLAAFSVVLAISPVRGAEGAAKRPNVLFIVADDLNTALGSYGHPLAKTPNLDRLASRGVRFDRAYCQYPLCGPSRNSFLTGLYPNSTGILTNSQIFRQTIPTQKSLPQLLRLNGYLPIRIGKMYHFNVPNSIGTDGHDDPGSWEIEMNPAGCDRLEEQAKIFSLTPGNFGASLSWLASKNPDAKHTDGMEADAAEWVLERCAKQKERPFFLALGFFRPHTPYVSPESYFQKYPLDDVKVVTGVEEDRKDIPPPALASQKKEQESMTDEQRKQAVQAYLAAVSFMDAQAGKVLDALDRLGLSENTIVVFTSDHGYHLGEHGLWQKQSLFEESTRVPLIIAGPGVPKPGVVKSPVGLIDLYPTLTELCGVRAPANLQGQSLASMLLDQSVRGRGWAVSEVMRGGGVQRRAATAGEPKPALFGYTIRTDRWRYTEWDEGRKGRELYDHEQDPKEIVNLAEAAEHAQTVGELSRKLREAVKSTYPADGVIPQLREGTWAPNLTAP